MEFKSDGTASGEVKKEYLTKMYAIRDKMADARKQGDKAEEVKLRKEWDDLYCEYMKAISKAVDEDFDAGRLT